MGVGQDRSQLLTKAAFYFASFIIFLLLVFYLQKLSGTYSSEFGGYPDEPAHYVTGVMVRDFLLGGKWDEPIKYANDYYKHYPKVAFGHWPPLLYAVQGVWMILFSESRTSILVELALTTALAAFCFYLAITRYFGRIAGFFSAVLLICLPIIQVYAAEEMAESLLLVNTFLAAIFFARYLERKRWQDSLWFAVFCSLAILTKGNGWALAIIPPVAIVLTRDWAVVKRPAFWIPVPVIAALCIPWQFMTMEMAQRGWTGGSKPSVAYAVQALGEFLVVTKDLVGWAVVALAVVGFVSHLVVPFRYRAVQPIFAVMFGLFVSMWVFHSIVPAGVEGRKMINALPAILFFAVAGVGSFAHFVSKNLTNGKLALRSSYAAVTVAALLLFAVGTFTVPREDHYGFTELSSYIESRPELQDSAILVSSDGDGEGLLVSELVMQDHRPSHTIIRATKLLSVSDWTGQVSEQLCKSSADIMRMLHQENVKAVVLDTFPPRVHYLHNELILNAIRDYPASWTLKSTFGQGKIRIYEFKQI